MNTQHSRSGTLAVKPTGLHPASSLPQQMLGTATAADHWTAQNVAAQPAEPGPHRVTSAIGTPAHRSAAASQQSPRRRNSLTQPGPSRPFPTSPIRVFPPFRPQKTWRGRIPPAPDPPQCLAAFPQPPVCEAPTSATTLQARFARMPALTRPRPSAETAAADSGDPASSGLQSFATTAPSG